MFKTQSSFPQINFGPTVSTMIDFSKLSPQSLRGWDSSVYVRCLETLTVAHQATVIILQTSLWFAFWQSSDFDLGPEAQYFVYFYRGVCQTFLTVLNIHDRHEGGNCTNRTCKAAWARIGAVWTVWNTLRSKWIIELLFEVIQATAHPGLPTSLYQGSEIYDSQ